MDSLLSEDQVKTIINDYYIALGYKTTVAWGHFRGADIIAQRGEERIIIEVKGSGSRPQMRVNYFISILGEMLQRMDKIHASRGNDTNNRCRRKNGAFNEKNEELQHSAAHRKRSIRRIRADIRSEGGG